MVEDAEEGEEEDVPSRLGLPSSILLDSDEEEPPLEFPSPSASGAGSSSSPSVLQLTYPEAGPSPLAARPHSAPATTHPSVRGRSSVKRRKVASVDPSPKILLRRRRRRLQGRIMSSCFRCFNWQCWKTGPVVYQRPLPSRLLLWCNLLCSPKSSLSYRLRRLLQTP